jgi:tetratricopeptide (TPR) repeat protein
MDDRIKQVLVLGREHYAKGEYEKAEEALREVLAHEDRFADVHDMLGVIAYHRGNLIVAERHFERAIAINPKYTEAALNLSVTYNDRGKYAEAREVYKRIQGKPAGSLEQLDEFARGKLANMHADIGQAYADAGLPHEAIEEYEKAVTLCPHFADLRTKLGALLRDVNNPARARAHYEKAIAAKPSYVPARIQLGAILLAAGEVDAAEEQWKKVIELDPENSRARMYLRVVQTEREKRSIPPPPASAGATSTRHAT